MATTSDISRGAFIRINGQLGMVLEYEHVTPNKTGAMYHVKLRNVGTGKLIEHRYRSGEKIDLVRVQTKDYQYLYPEGEALVFMDNETYEQFYMDKSLLGENIKFLKDGLNISISRDDDDNPIYAELPTFVELAVTYSEPGIKGDTATNAMKPATLESGAEVRVPLFVNEGDVLKIDTRTGEYVERAKK